MSAVPAQDVKTLRQRTGAPILACREALAEAEGDFERAVDILRTRGEARAAKRAGAEARQGVVQYYIHPGNQIGVLVEVDCETDFVARTDRFSEFARDVALHIAAQRDLLAVSDDDVPEEEREREARIAAEQLSNVPEQARDRAVAGKLDSWLDEVVLLRQPHVNSDKYEGRTIEELRAALSSETGENVVIRRFARFQVGD
jgi:elongation factor Ts